MRYKSALLIVLVASGFATSAFAGVKKAKRVETGYQRTVGDGLVEFREVKDFGSSEFECEYTRDQCDETQMEKELKEKCALDGFLSCETTVRMRVEIESGDDYFFCGQWHKGQCVVSVKGYNSSSTSTSDAVETIPETEIQPDADVE
jgi:hypothetical protein